MPPQHGSTYEAGIKGAWQDGRLNAASTVYRNVRDHLAIRAGRRNGQTYYNAEDHTTNRGAELSISGRVGDKWLLNASYARSFSRKADGSPVKTNYPEHLFKLFASYDINNKITLGGNIHWQSRLYDSSIKNMPDAASRSAVSQRPYAVVDLMMHINLGKQTRLSLYADNVFNKSYKTMPDIHVYGTPRRFSAVLRHTF